MSTQPLVSIVMGSKSDWPIMSLARDICLQFEVECEVRVLSAHRSPDDTADFARQARSRGVTVIIAGAGGAAHLAGVLAAHSTLAVIGVPVASGTLQGLDSLLATVQMPRGIPVATVGINRADNAALLAIQILSLKDQRLAARLEQFRSQLAEGVREAETALRADIEEKNDGNP